MKAVRGQKHPSEAKNDMKDFIYFHAHAQSRFEVKTKQEIKTVLGI